MTDLENDLRYLTKKLTECGFSDSLFTIRRVIAILQRTTKLNKEYEKDLEDQAKHINKLRSEILVYEETIRKLQCSI